MLQLIRAILKDPGDPTQCFLLFANQVGLLFSVLGFESSCVVGLSNVVPEPILASIREPPCKGEDPTLQQGGQSIEPNSFPGPQGRKQRKHLRNLSLSAVTCSLGFLC